MKKQLSTILSMLLILLICSNSATAQIDPNLYGQQNQQRSIWDKQPEEPKTDQPTPFGSNTQRAGTASVQQNGTLADPPPFGGNTQDGVPIDGGLGFLLAAGVGYGVKKLKKLRSRSQGKVKE